MPQMRKRLPVSEDNRANIMMVMGAAEDFFKKIPTLDDKIKGKFADMALEFAMNEAKSYPPQMQNLVISWGVGGFIGSTVALMVMDMLYENGTFKPLTEKEKVTSNLIMFSDILPVNE